MAEVKFKELKKHQVTGKGNCIGAVKLKEFKETPDVSVDDNKSTDTIKVTVTDHGLYKITSKTDKQSNTVKDVRLSMSFPIEVNGSIHTIFLSGENYAETANGKYIKKNEDGSNVYAHVDNAEQYIDDVMNPIWFSLLEQKKFVAVHNLIKYIAKNATQIDGKRVDIKMDLEVNIYNGRTSTRKNITSVKEDKSGTDMFVGFMPMFIAKNMFSDITYKNRKSVKLKTKAPTQISEYDGEKNNYFMKLQDCELLSLSEFMNNTPEANFTPLVTAYQNMIKKPGMRNVAFRITKGSEPKATGELDEATKLIIANMDEAAKEEYLKIIDKGFGVRPYAQEKYEFTAFQAFSEDTIVIDPETDIYIPTDKPKEVKKKTTEELKSYTATSNSPAPTMPTGMTMPGMN